MKPPKLEADLGIEFYASKTPGIGGKIRLIPKDFKVEEILTDGSEVKLQTEVPKVSGWGRYLLCILEKKNQDTLIAIRRIAESLDISPDRIKIGGIKDARALTAQHVTIAAMTPEKVSKISIRDITIRPVRFVDEELGAYLLLGNKFRIVIRAIHGDEATVKKRIENIRGELEELGGMPNYFGHQRFGTTRPITHKVGYYILKRDFEKAAMVFLSQTGSFEHPYNREARQHLIETQDFKTALKRFPRRLLYERLMLRHLAKYPRDFLGALHRLPTKLQKLFVQAYQSYLFNRFLSERIRQGIPLRKPQLGDHIIELDQLGLPTRICYKATEENLPEIKGKVDGGRAGIAIPLIGFKQPPSEGMQGRIEETIHPEDFQIPQMLKASSPGGLRLVFTPIIDLQVREPLEDRLNPNRLMFELGFMLHRGSYATILLREFMKPISSP